MPSAGLETAIAATKLPQTYALNRAATGIGLLHHYAIKFQDTLCLAFVWILFYQIKEILVLSGPNNDR
jgi:hypothetical protein